MSVPNEVTEHYERVTGILDEYINQAESFLNILYSFANTFTNFTIPSSRPLDIGGQPPTIALPPLITPTPPQPPQIQPIPIPTIPTIPPPPELTYNPVQIDISIIQSTIQSLQTALETAIERIQQDKATFQGITEDMLTAISGILPELQDMVALYSTFIKDSQEYINTTYENLKQQVDEVNNSLQEKINNSAYNEIITRVQDSINALKEFSDRFSEWFDEGDFSIANKIESDLDREIKIDISGIDVILQRIKEIEDTCHSILQEIKDIQPPDGDINPPNITLPQMFSINIPEPPELIQLDPVEINTYIDLNDFEFEIPDINFGEILNRIESELSRIRDPLEQKYETFVDHLQQEIDRIRNEKLQKWEEYYAFVNERFKKIRDEGLQGSPVDKGMAQWLPDYFISPIALESDIHAIYNKYSALGYRISPDKQYAILGEVIRKYLEDIRPRVIEFIEKRLANYKESLAYSEKAFVDATLNSIEIHKILLDYEEKILMLYVKLQEIIFSIKDKLYQQAISYMELLQEHTKLHLARIQTKLEVLKSKLQIIELKVSNEKLKIDYNNSLLLSYREYIEAILSRLKYYEAQTVIERAKIELYEANIRAMALKNEVEIAKLKVPELKLGLYDTLARVENTHIETVRTKIEALLQETNQNQDRIAKKIQLFNTKVAEWQAKQELKYKHRALNFEAINSIVRAAIAQLEGYNSYINTWLNYASNMREMFQIGMNVALTVVDSKLKALAGQAETYRIALSGLTSALSSIVSTIEPYLNANLAEAKGLTEALRAQVSAISAITEENRNHILYIQSEYDKYRAQIAGIQAQIEGEVSKMRPPAEYNKAVLEHYIGELQSFQTRVNTELTKYKTQAEVNFQNAQYQIEGRRLTTQINIENLRWEMERLRLIYDIWKSQKEIVLGGARAGAEVGAAILSSALTSMNSIVNLSQNLIGAIES